MTSLHCPRTYGSLATRLLVSLSCAVGIVPARGDDAALDPTPFGAEFSNLDGRATGAWWTKRAKQRGDGYGIARFDFADTTRGADGTLTFECWPRFPRVGADGSPTQYPGWPVQVPIKEDRLIDSYSVTCTRTGFSLSGISTG